MQIVLGNLGLFLVYLSSIKYFLDSKHELSGALLFMPGTTDVLQECQSKD